MQFFKHLFLFATAVSALAVDLERRTPATTLNDLKDVDSKTNAFTAAIKAWDGTAAKVGPVFTARDNLTKSVTAARDGAANQPVASSTDSKSILNYVKNPLTPDTKTALDTLVGRKADITKVNLTNQVNRDLNTLRTLTAQLADNLIKSASSDTVNDAKAAKTTIDNYFASAIAQFPSSK